MRPEEIMPLPLISINEFWDQELRTFVSSLVRWYIFDIGTIRLSLRFNEFFSLWCVGSTCAWWHDADGLLN
jgi:hypothetical protein